MNKKISYLRKGVLFAICALLAGCATPKKRPEVPNKATDIAAYNPSEYHKAYAYFSEKAAHGDPVAMDNLGRMYEDGRGVEPDDQKAIYWYTKAAAHGNKDAALNLGVAYLYGKGVPKDKKVACEWFSKGGEGYARSFYQTYC